MDLREALEDIKMRLMASDGEATERVLNFITWADGHELFKQELSRFDLEWQLPRRGDIPVGGETKIEANPDDKGMRTWCIHRIDPHNQMAVGKLDSKDHVSIQVIKREHCKTGEEFDALFP